MKSCATAAVLILLYGASVYASAQSVPPRHENRVTVEQLQQEFFSDFNLPAAAADADEFLRHQPGDFSALFVRMETATLQQRTGDVLDSALRLCTMPAPPAIQEIASSRILENAGNSGVFNDVLRRVGLAMENGNACTFNLRLALVAAAADGTPRLDLDKTAESAGLLTRWRIAGPFGELSDIDFDRQWPPETQQFWTTEKSSEAFWFRNGMASLPDYMSKAGVFYAASDLRIGPQRTSQLDILSPGPYAVFVDGRRVLAKDSRFVTTGNRESVALHLAQGWHRLVIKFTRDAGPFSVDCHPAFGRATTTMVPAPLASYVRALLEFFRGNLTGVARLLPSQEGQDRAAFLFLRALLWSAAEERSPRSRAAWDEIRKAQPSALLARIRLAELAVDNDDGGWKRQDLDQLEQLRPDSEAVARLKMEFARDDSRVEAKAVKQLLDLHPTCTRLAEAIQFYTSIGDQENAQKAETMLRLCAPDSLAYARVLAAAGRHREVSSVLLEKIARNGLDRTARRMLVQELVLAGDLDSARLQAQRLHKLAPGNQDFAALAYDPALILDSHSPRAATFMRGAEFYTGYRRDGLKAVVAAQQQGIIDGTATLLLLDRVLDIRDDGTASLYSHVVMRLLNQDAISRYGEVALPRGSDILQLRTIKQNGRAIEPELTNQKSTISMPALEPGDSMEQELVTHFPDWRHLPAPASVLELASSTMPVANLRYTLIVCRSCDVAVELRNGAPLPRVDHDNTHLIRTWTRADVPIISAEPFSPESSLLPAVLISAKEASPAAIADSLIDSTRVGPHVIEAALAQHFGPATNEAEKARQLYRYVISHIDSTGPDFTTTSAEDALAAGEGSRTATLLALARTVGLKASLLLARRVDHDCTGAEEMRCYKEPLVRFWAGGQVIDSDAEANDLAFGAVPAGLDLQSALLVPVGPRDRASFSSQFVRLALKPNQERSVGEGDLFLDADGNLTATIHVRLGASRSQEIRTGLRAANNRQQQAYFEQLATRIFPGATAVQGQAIHLGDSEQPLELNLSCKVLEFIDTHSGLKETGQFAPALALRNIFARTGSRRLPLFVDSVLFENTVFHLHLSPGMAVQSLPQDFTMNSGFGDYMVRFSQRGSQIDVVREFNIPVQLVAPEDFPAFLQFAERIEKAERQHLTLQMRSTARAPQGQLPNSL